MVDVEVGVDRHTVLDVARHPTVRRLRLVRQRLHGAVGGGDRGGGEELALRGAWGEWF